MEFQEVMARRYSCRKFLNKPIPRPLLEALADAGRLAPSGCNLQPWRFIAVDDPEKKQAIAAAVYDEKTGVNGFAPDIPAFIVIVHTPPEDISDLQRYLTGQCGGNYLAGLDIGCAGMEMCLAATSMGLGALMMGMINQETIRSALAIPEQYQVPLIVGVGYPAQAPANPRPRRPLTDVLRWNTFTGAD